MFITQDNLKAHMTLELTEFCRQQKMVMQNFPAKTTHILQPLDACFANLKASFSSIAKKAQLANPGGLVNKANFSGKCYIAYVKILNNINIVILQYCVDNYYTSHSL